MPFMPTNTPQYLALAAHCAIPTEDMSLEERIAHVLELIRLKHAYVASVPKWKRMVAAYATPVLIVTSFAIVVGTSVFFLSRLLPQP